MISLAQAEAVVVDALSPVIDQLNAQLRAALPHLKWDQALIYPITLDREYVAERQKIEPVRVCIDLDEHEPRLEWDMGAINQMQRAAFEALRGLEAGSIVYTWVSDRPVSMLVRGSGYRVMVDDARDGYYVMLGMYYAVVPGSVVREREEAQRLDPIERMMVTPEPATPSAISWNEAMSKKRAVRGISLADIRALEETIPPQIDPEQARKMFDPIPALSNHRCACGQAILPSRATCDRCQGRIDDAVAKAAAVKVTNEQIRLLAEKRDAIAQKVFESNGMPAGVINPAPRDRFAGIGPGVHLEWRSSGEATRVVIVARDMTADQWQVRPVASDGALGPVTTLTSEQVEWACSVLGAIPTHEPPAAPRGRARLKPGVTL